MKEHKRVLYYTLLTSGKLYEHLAEIDTSARDMAEYLIKEMARKQGVTEELKARDMLRWVGKMNNIRACADEIVLNDIVYSCASLLLANGVPMKMIQEWLGHSDFSPTANIYSHLDYASKVSSAEAMLNGLGMGSNPGNDT